MESSLNPWDREADGMPITDEERDLPFEYDPSKDYFAEVDKRCPPYQVPHVLYPAAGGQPTKVALSDASGTREVAVRVDVPEDGKRRKRTVRMVMGHRRYVRAVDLAGAIQQLTVASMRPDWDNQVGVDSYTQQRTVMLKSGRGWLVLERERSMMNPYAPFIAEPNRYCAWALAVADMRKKIHEEHIHADAREKEEGVLRIEREKAAIHGAAMAESMERGMDKAFDRAAKKKDKADKGSV